MISCVKNFATSVLHQLTHYELVSPMFVSDISVKREHRYFVVLIVYRKESLPWLNINVENLDIMTLHVIL